MASPGGNRPAELDRPAVPAVAGELAGIASTWLQVSVRRVAVREARGILRSRELSG